MRPLFNATLSALSLSLLAGCTPSTVEKDPCDTANCGQDSTPTVQNAEPRSLVAIGYNDAEGVNELYSINVETAEVTTLLSFEFDSGSWWPGIVSDTENGVLYCVSMNNTLYRIAMDGSSIEAMGELSKSIQNMGMGTDQLIGIGYKEISEKNVLRSIDPATGEVSDILDFTFESGSWELNVTPNVDAGEFYVSDTDHNLYRIKMDGSAVDVIGQYGPHVFFARGQEGLAGIVYNEDTERYEVVNLSTETGQITVLNDFTFNTSDWNGYVVADPDAGVFYGLSNTQTLYRFHMDDGEKEKIGRLSQGIQVMGLGPL